MDNLYGENIKIKVFLKDKNNLLANATVSFNTISYGFVTIKDFQIWRSKNFNERLQEAINITPPTRNMHGHFLPTIFLEDRKKWYELESKIYDTYCLAKNEETKKEDLKINPDDIHI